MPDVIDSTLPAQAEVEAVAAQAAPVEVVAEPVQDPALSALEEGLKAADSEAQPAQLAEEAPQEASEVAEEAVEPAPPSTPEEEAAAAEAAADEAAAAEARAAGFKNEKGVQAYQAIHKRAREAERELGSYKARIEEVEPQAQAYVKFRTHMESIGTQPEQFGLAVAMIEAWNSQDPAKLNAVEQELVNQLSQVREKLGKSGDVLSAHPDLATAVEEGMPRTQAEELANRRNLERQTQQYQAQQTTQAQRQQEEYQRAVQSAVQDMDVLGNELSQQDKHFAAKKDAALAEFLKVRDNTPPQKWEATFLKIYNKIPSPAPAPAKPAPTAVPLRASAASPVRQVATTAEEALELGLRAADQGATW